MREILILKLTFTPELALHETGFQTCTSRPKAVTTIPKTPKILLNPANKKWFEDNETSK